MPPATAELIIGAAAAATAHDDHLITQLDSARYNFSGHGGNDSTDDYYDYGCV